MLARLFGSFRPFVACAITPFQRILSGPGTRSGLFSGTRMKNNKPYANPCEFRYYAQACRLGSSPRNCRLTTARRWLTADGGIPWWVLLVLKLDFSEGQERARQMGYRTGHLAAVTWNVYAFPQRKQIDRTSANRLAALSLALAAEPGTMQA